MQATLWGVGLGSCQGRQKQTGQDGDDGDDHEQFDQRECGLTAPLERMDGRPV